MEAKVELNLPHWNPVLHCGNSERDTQACPGSDLWLFYKVPPSLREAETTRAPPVALFVSVQHGMQAILSLGLVPLGIGV